MAGIRRRRRQARTLRQAAGDRAQNLLAGKSDEAEAVARRYLDLLGKENYYLEIQNHQIDIEDKVRPRVIELARRLGVRAAPTTLLVEDGSVAQVLLGTTAARKAAQFLGEA